MAASSAATGALRQRLLVIGGNGYLGSAVCKAGVARGWEVASVSSSGKPWRTPSGHARKWTDNVAWHSADAFDPSTYQHLLSDETTAVVHTLGILIEDDAYKRHVASGNVMGLLGSLMRGGGASDNPLMRGLRDDGKGKARMTYERMNRDSALTVFRALLDVESRTGTDTAQAGPSTPHASRPFVYISAEDVFRPVISERYVATKRQAESEILRLCAEAQTQRNTDIRPIFVRPVLLDVSSSIHRVLGQPPAPSILPAKMQAAADTLKIPPIHVDQVAECVVRSIENPLVSGVVDTRTMRQWVGLERADGTSFASTFRPNAFTGNHLRHYSTSTRQPMNDVGAQFDIALPDEQVLHADEDFGPETELIPANEARLKVTEAAWKQLLRVGQKEPDNKDLALRLAVESGGCHGYQYKMDLTEQERQKDDYVFQGPGEHCLPILVDLTSLGLLRGSTLHFATELIGSSFRIEHNPQAKEGGSCGCGVSWEAI